MNYIVVMQDDMTRIGCSTYGPSHARMLHSLPDMNLSTKSRALKVSNGSGLIIISIPLWAFMVLNGSFISEPPPLVYVHSTLVAPPRLASTHPSLVPFAPLVHYVLMASSSSTMLLRRRHPFPE